MEQLLTLKFETRHIVVSAVQDFLVNGAFKVITQGPRRPFEEYVELIRRRGKFFPVEAVEADKVEMVQSLVVRTTTRTYTFSSRGEGRLAKFQFEIGKLTIVHYTPAEIEVTTTFEVYGSARY